MTHELAAESVFSVVVSFARKNKLERGRILQRDDFSKEQNMPPKAKIGYKLLWIICKPNFT
jgi:hypothetical protein